MRQRDGLEAQLGAAQRRIAELESQISRKDRHDPVAGNALTLPAFRTQVEMDMQQAARGGRPLTMAIVDVDAFRRLNLRHGYATGDRVLVAVSELLVQRTGGLVCRIAADTFAVRMTDADVGQAKDTLEAVLFELEAQVIGEVNAVSVSVGIAQAGHGATLETLLAAAEAALEGARQEGGRRVATFTADAVGAHIPEEEGGADVAAALAAALEERDRYTGEHSESVVDLTARVAQALGLGADEVSDVRRAALLHDIGKVGIPDEILNKPGPLDQREWEIMREHPAIGERILRAIPGLGPIARVVRHEHERWDGGGYPDGLSGTEIPLAARIILACDAYHAMVSDRPYRRAMSHADAMAELNANAGTQFDPDVVQALIGYLYGRRQSGLSAV